MALQVTVEKSGLATHRDGQDTIQKLEQAADTGNLKQARGQGRQQTWITRNNPDVRTGSRHG